MRPVVALLLLGLLAGCGGQGPEPPAEPAGETGGNGAAPIDEGVITANDERFGQLYNTGLLFFHIDDFGRAEEAFRQALELRPSDPKPYLYMGKIALEQKKYSPAEEAARDALRRDPGFFAADLLLAEILFKSNQLEKGREQVEALLKSHPGNPEVYYWLGFMRERQNDYPGAIEAFEKLLVRNPDHVEGWFHRGLAHMKMQDWELARDAFNAALRLDPNHYGSLFNLQKVYGRLGDEENRARVQQQYQDLMTRMEEQIYKNTKIAFYSNRGITHFNAGDYEGAVKEFQTAIDMNPEKAHGFYYLGMCYVQMGRPADAVAALTRAVEIAPDDERMIVELARAQAMNGDLTQAAGLFEKAIRLNPYFDMPHYYLAGIQRALGRQDDAREHMAEFQRLRLLAGTSLSP